MRDRGATIAIRQLAEKQHGVVAHRQVLGIGEGRGLALRRREGGLLIPVHRGVYALGHGRLTREGRWMAAVLACGPGAVLSHFSGGNLWSLCGSRGPVEVLRRAGGAKDTGHRGVLLHQTRRLESFEVGLEKGIPVATIERVLLDLAARTDSKQLERIFVQAYKTGRLSWSNLDRVLERGRGRKGIGKLRRIAQEVDPQALETRSVTEVDFLALCREAGLSTPAVNVLVADHLVDFLWPVQKVIVETDSWSHHGDRPTFERDRQTDVDLVANGYDVHRTTYKMLERNPGAFLGNVRRALRRRTESTSTPSR
jgi:hypothetical protein